MIRLLVLGDLNLDVHAEEPTPTACGQETRSIVRITPGGSAGTFARVAASLGADVVFLGAVGNDVGGDLLERDLVAHGIRPRLARVAEPTGAVLALHRGGDRSMICARGANEGLDEHAVDPTLFAGLDHLHVSGYAFLSESQARAARRALALAQVAGATTSVNAPPASLIEAFGVEAFLGELREVALLFLNRDEGRLLTGRIQDAAIVDGLAATHPAGALTLGAEGAIAWRGDERSLECPPARLDVDPTGAGDAFAAAFVVYLLAGDALGAANRAACAAAHAHLASR
jgi:sugar/nucleoside kinase (ribokinase family)